jgi:hypothetical protein
VTQPRRELGALLSRGEGGGQELLRVLPVLRGQVPYDLVGSVDVVDEEVVNNLDVVGADGARKVLVRLGQQVL